MFFLFLTKKPAVFIGLFFVYIFISLIQAMLVLYTLPGGSQGGYFFVAFMFCLPFPIFFYRAYLYLCMGYSTIFAEPPLSFRGVPLNKFKNTFYSFICFYALTIVLNIILARIFHYEVFFIVSLCFLSLIYERFLLYAIKWVMLYELAKKGVKLNEQDLQGSMDDARQLFLSSFSPSKFEG